MKGTNFIRNWNDFSRYGIQYLTGESDAYAIRLLCDLNQKGKELIETFFCISIPMNTNWNHTVNGEPAVASVLLPRSIFMELAKFCFFHVNHCYAMVHFHDELIGVDERWYNEYKKDAEKYQAVGIEFYRNPNYNPDPDVTVGDRNIHKGSGRVR